MNYQINCGIQFVDFDGRTWRHEADCITEAAENDLGEALRSPKWYLGVVSKDTTSKVISIMVNNKNEAMPMKLVSKDTNDQAVPMMDVNKDTTRPCLRWLSSWPTARRRPPLVPSQRVPIRRQDHLCTPVPVKKSRPLTRMLSSQTGKIGQSSPQPHPRATNASVKSMILRFLCS